MRKYSMIKISDKDIEDIYNTLIELDYSGIANSNLECLANGGKCIEPNFLCLNVPEKRYEFIADNYVIDDTNSNYFVKRYKSWKHFVPLIKGRAQI